MQYLLHTLGAYNMENEVVSEKIQINKKKVDKLNDLIRKQDQELSKLKGDLKLLENERKHQMYLIDNEKQMNKDSEEQVRRMIERLKRGEVNLSDEDQYVKDFRESMIQVSHYEDE